MQQNFLRREISIVQGIKDMVLSVKKVRPLKEAQVSRGEVDTLGDRSLRL
jgi:predicted flavoprotein YhiN